MFSKNYWQRSSSESLLNDVPLSPSHRSSGANPSVHPQVKKVELRELIRAIWVVSKAFFQDEASKRRSISMAVLLLVMMFGFAFINLWFLTTFRDFNNALHDKDKDKFYDLMYRICVVALAIMPVSAARDALKGSLALEWRRYLTNTLMSKYIGDSQAFYRLKLHGCDLDNPDQRIAQDTGEFTGALLHFTTVVMQACIVILTQSGMLMAISPELFLFVVAYCLIMNVVTFVVFGGRLTAVNRSVLAQEASLRFGLVRVRENAEPIAFYQGAAFEKARCGDFFAELMSTLYAKMCLMVTFESFQATMGLFVSVLPYMVVAGKYLSGDLDFGAMSEAAAVLAALERSFNTMVSQMERMSSMGAQAVRIQQIWEVLDHISEVHEGKYSDDGALLERGGEMGARGVSLVELPADSLLRADVALLRLEDITLQPPLGQVALVHDLSFELKSGDSLLVCGPSGIGKSSLLRAIGGLWASGRGSIERCASSQCFFVPQEPYLCLGSLRENATYPGSFTAGGVSSSSSAPSPTDAEIRAALADVNISYLLERFDLDEAVDLDTVLSGGERQRLGFARLLLRPAGLRFAIMDEATSALDEVNENKVYQLLRARVASYISVGHRANLENFHTHRLNLERTALGGCSWRMGRTKAFLSDAAGGAFCASPERDEGARENEVAEAILNRGESGHSSERADAVRSDTWSPL
mmetsp:Transcript_115710/g.367958  ORF Transcript_115710/g.367958 Transcript_115710/m.367958 type:complete len:698 (+) Transcript_115710:156-2249(+)